MASRTALTADRILSATEEVLRRHGPTKATVVDVARALGVSHSAVYKHFPTKQALREAVTRRWLEASRDALAEIAEDATTSPPERLHAWLSAVLSSKRAKASNDPELFAAFGMLATEHSTVAEEHVADLLAQLQTIVSDGIADTSFRTMDPTAAARGIFDATAQFNDIRHAQDWQEPEIQLRLDAVCTLLLQGLQTTSDSG